MKTFFISSCTEVPDDMVYLLKKAVEKAIEMGSNEFWCNIYDTFSRQAIDAVLECQRSISLSITKIEIDCKQKILKPKDDKGIYLSCYDLESKWYAKVEQFRSGKKVEDAIFECDKWKAEECDIVISYCPHHYGKAWAIRNYMKNVGKTVIELEYLQKFPCKKSEIFIFT